MTNLLDAPERRASGGSSPGDVPLRPLAVAAAVAGLASPGVVLLGCMVVGLLGWFAQGIGEFGLYVPALAWTAFTLLGCSLALTASQFDKKPSHAL